ncbi:MAG: type IV secretory system conjugative DNA transfer family protein [Bacteroidales bacterium]|jgi:type IV secretory pathway TraG/TraD family ATPase VirD4
METIINSIFEGAYSILSSGVEMLESVFFDSKKKEYSADFASIGTLLSSFNHGFCLTGKKNLTCKDSFQNAMCIGGTGTGKSTIVLIPSLFSMRGSFITHDPSGELFSKTSGFLKQKGYEVKVLNFANPHISCGYNPIFRATTSSEINKVSNMLIETTLGSGKAKDPFWSLQGKSLLTMLISILKTKDSEYQNLYNVRQLLNQLGGSPQGVDKLFSENADPVLFSEYKSFISHDDKLVSGVVATCKAALQLFSDDSVARVTSFDNLDFMEFRNKPTVLFIQNSVADQKYYSVLTSLFFEQFFSFLLGRFPNDDEQDIFLLIDECSSLNLPTLPLAIANVRKHRAGAMLLLQDYNQLIHNYGKPDADGIRANCFLKMYFTGQSLETCKELEQTLGKYQYEDEEKKKTVVRELMTSNEIRTMPIDEALLICGHHLPVKAKLKPYYENITYNAYSKIPAPNMLNEDLPVSVPILPLNVPEKVKYE